jgi:membrane protein DedA with SNARE-associated domain
MTVTERFAQLAINLIVDSMGVPIPSEILLPLSGALVKQGQFSFVMVLIVATVAQSFGAFLAYEIGATGGIKLVKRYGKYVLFNERELATTQRWFDRYGAWLTLVGRCLPVIRTYIGYPAGIAKMPRHRFLIATVVGSFFWSLILIVAGYIMADNLKAIDTFLHKFSIVILGLLVLAVIWYVVRHWRGRKTAN